VLVTRVKPAVRIDLASLTAGDTHHYVVTKYRHLFSLSNKPGSPMRGLRGKRVLVSGGSSGIGASAAQRFLEEGCRVVVGGLEPVEVESLVRGLRGLGEVHGIAADVSQEGGATALVQGAVEALGGLDVLANNAGTAWREPFLEITPDHWDMLLAVNLRGMFLVGQAVAQAMVRQGTGGAIITMSSTNGLAAERDYAHYNASKAGVLLLTKTMAVELAEYGIRVNALCPGFIRTALNEKISVAISPDFIDSYGRDNVPLKRVGLPQEIAAAYAFLASDDASFITGTELVVDGGQTAVM
jgi:3-oxoacyl-[acyl-carrier protein] reductase